ncbi:MAG: PilZ domain-containing protein [Novosphingobium sp.]
MNTDRGIEDMVARGSATHRHRTVRQSVELPVIAEHRRLGDLPMRIVNISAEGFRGEGDFATDGASALGRGERIIVRLPVVGRIEACLVWSSAGRGGFHFERPIRAGDFAALLQKLRPTEQPGSLPLIFKAC